MVDTRLSVAKMLYFEEKLDVPRQCYLVYLQSTEFRTSEIYM